MNTARPGFYDVNLYTSSIFVDGTENISQTIFDWTSMDGDLCDLITINRVFYYISKINSYE